MGKMGVVVGLLLVCFLLGGCVPSLNPFFTADAKVTMPELNGKWTMLGTNEDAFSGGNECTFIRSPERVRIQIPCPKRRKRDACATKACRGRQKWRELPARGPKRLDY